MSYAPAVEQAATEWLTKHRATTDPEVLHMILQRAQQIWENQGGYFSAAHIERAYLELANSGVIKTFKGSMEAKIAESSESIPAEVIAYIQSAPAREQARRYRTDATFRRQYDEYTRRNVSPQQASDVPSSAAQYHQIPARVVAKRYASEPRFRAAIDSLISRGLI